MMTLNQVVPTQKVEDSLAAFITKTASQQTYDTIRFLVDADRVGEAYQAYGYFRWVDDWLDQGAEDRAERIAFVERQQAVIDSVYRGVWPRNLSVEEEMVAELIRSDAEPYSGLQAYIRNMMAVMAFDAGRRGQLITQGELNAYSHHLAVGVTEAMHYFIGHDEYCAPSESRYRAVTAAHITHMLRDTCEDIAAGYYNIPREYVQKYGAAALEVESDAGREWVKSQVQLARSYFQAGKNYLAQIPNARCRMAGYAYSARFEATLAAIEQDDYRLRAYYPEQDSTFSGVK
ncbi:MAG TPA: squalene/phytoene synthase family protein [Aggregatilineaceae bacterium]|nr:squalene/phytoene synthase family protein [Aggregatilineaceae bacterium]